MIEREIIDLKTDLQLLPTDPTNESMCSDQFLHHSYQRLSLSFIEKFNYINEQSDVEAYKNKLGVIYQDITNVKEKLEQFVNLEIQAKRILSPTISKILQSQINKQDMNKVGILNTEPLLVLSKRFVDRLHIDKEIYYLTKIVQNILNDIKQVFNEDKIQQTYQQNQQFFNDYVWLLNEYNPDMRGLVFNLDKIEQTQDFSIDRYRYWSLTMYLKTISADEKDIAQSVQYLKQLEMNIQDQQSYFYTISNFEEVLVFGCDLYTALLFEFTLLVQNNENVSDKNYDNYNHLFKFIEKYQQPINNNPNLQCPTAVSRLDYFVVQILQLTIFQTFDNNQYRINFQGIDGMLREINLENYDPDTHEQIFALYNFDLFMIEHFINRTFDNEISIEDLRLIFQQVTKFKSLTKLKNDKLNIIYEITFQFLQYLLTIESNEKVKAAFTLEGIKRSIRMQYLIFCQIRLDALIYEKDIYKSYDDFILIFKNAFKRKIDQQDEDLYIYLIGQNEWETTLIITIEIITIMLEQNTNYMTEIYTFLDDGFRHLKLQEVKLDKLNDVTKGFIQSKGPITDQDFTYLRLINRIFINLQIEDLIDYINLTQTESNEDHLRRKKRLFSVLVDLMQQIENENALENHDKLKGIFVLKIQENKEKEKNKTFLTNLKQSIESSQQDFIEIYQNVFLSMYKHIQLQIFEKVYDNSHSSAFLDFLIAYQSREDLDIDYASISNVDETQYNIKTILSISLGEDEQCTFEQKWNEDMLADALFVYPWILVKQREESSDVCLDYDPTLPNQKEEQVLGIESSNELNQARKTQCIDERDEKFARFLMIQDSNDEDAITQSMFVKQLIFSPEFYLYSEQFYFMIDAFQIFDLLQSYTETKIIQDQQVQNIFVDIFRFIVQIRSDPNFVYDGDFWNTIMRYMQQCMYYQRHEHGSEVKYYCHYGYARYNEMYWFLLFAEFRETNDFTRLEKALQTKNQGNNQTQYPEDDNWGSRLNARFNQFVHYLLQVSSINDTQKIDSILKEAQSDRNAKLYIFELCDLRSNGQNALDFCKFLSKIKEVEQLLSQPQVDSDEFQLVNNILLKNVQNENDKIISWEVLDFFQFQQDVGSEDVMEKIRKLYDKVAIDNIKQNPEQHTLSTLFKINDTNLLGQYAQSKYDENTTVRNQTQQQSGMSANTQNASLQKIVRNILKNEQKVTDFLLLKQKQSLDSLFAQFKMIHNIPLSLLLYYADDLKEFVLISKVVLSLNKLDLLFLSDVDAGLVIVNNFERYIQKQFQNITKDVQKYTEANLINFIGVVEKENSANRNNKQLKKQALMNNPMIKYKQTSQVNISTHTLLQKMKSKVNENHGVINNGQINRTTLISENSLIQDVQDLSERSRNDLIKNETVDELQREISERAKVYQQKNIELKNSKSKNIKPLTEKELVEKVSTTKFVTSQSSLDQINDKVNKITNAYEQSFVVQDSSNQKSNKQEQKTIVTQMKTEVVQQQKRVIRLKNQKGEILSEKVSVIQKDPIVTVSTNVRTQNFI